MPGAFEYLEPTAPKPDPDVLMSGIPAPAPFSHVPVTGELRSTGIGGSRDPRSRFDQDVSQGVYDASVGGLLSAYSAPNNFVGGFVEGDPWRAAGGAAEAAFFALPGIKRLQGSTFRHADDWGGTNRLREAEAIWGQGGGNADTWTSHGWMQPTEAFGTRALKTDPGPMSWVSDVFDINPNVTLDPRGMASGSFDDIFELGPKYRRAVDPRALETPTTLRINPHVPYGGGVEFESIHSGFPRLGLNKIGEQPNKVTVTGGDHEMARQIGIHEFDHLNRMWENPNYVDWSGYKGHATDAPIIGTLHQKMQQSIDRMDALKKQGAPFPDIQSAGDQADFFGRLKNDTAKDVHYYSTHPELEARAATAFELMPEHEVRSTVPGVGVAYRDDAFPGGFSQQHSAGQAGYSFDDFMRFKK